MMSLSPGINLDTIPDAIAAIEAGKAVVVVDDHNRENEGDIVFAAELATTELTGFTVRHTSGVLCVPMPGPYADALDLPPMTEVNQDAKGTAYTVTCDAKEGITTGISAADRAHTARVLASPAATAGDITRPGHMLPLRAVTGGVRQRPGHTEAAVDLCTLAGLAPVGVIAELVHDDGSMMRLPALRDFATTHGLPLISIEDLSAYLQSQSGVIEEISEPVLLPLPEGLFEVRAWRGVDTDGVLGQEHMSLTAVVSDASSRGSDAPLVRLHSECLTGDVFGSYRCDCGPQLHKALSVVAAEGGTLIYLRGHEGRGIGLVNKLRAYRLQDQGADTVEANEMLGLPVDARQWNIAASILRELGITRLRLLTNNPLKVQALENLGIEVCQRIPHEVSSRVENQRYLRTKRDRMNHVLTNISDHNE